VALPRQLLVGQGVAGAVAVDLDAGLEFLARAGGHTQDGGEGVRERRAAALVLDAAHQGSQGEAAGVTGSGVGEVLVFLVAEDRPQAVACTGVDAVICARRVS
jgi:hypothetical protein